MDMNSLTQKSQEALTSAQSIAVLAGQIDVDRAGGQVGGGSVHVGVGHTGVGDRNVVGVRRRRRHSGSPSWPSFGAARGANHGLCPPI